MPKQKIASGFPENARKYYRNKPIIIISVNQTIMIRVPKKHIFSKTFFRIPNMDIFKMSKSENPGTFVKQKLLLKNGLKNMQINL